jgi:hypothetical protein
MSTALRPQATLKQLGTVANVPRRDAALVKAVLEVLRPCPVPRDGWRKKDLLRGRTALLVNLFAAVRELKEGGSTPAQIELVNVALAGAIRSIAIEGLPPAHHTFAEFWERESRCQGEEDVLTVAAREHASPGTYRALAAALIAENEAQSAFIDWLMAEAMRMEAA